MGVFAAADQMLIAVGTFNVWVLRYGRPTPYRPGEAQHMAEMLLLSTVVAVS